MTYQSITQTGHVTEATLWDAADARAIAQHGETLCETKVAYPVGSLLLDFWVASENVGEGCILHRL